jgi:peptidyl-Lys metalloendopeptidase
MVMRVGPLAESWIRIAPRATVSAKVNLSNSYDLSRKGQYSIEYQAKAVVLSGVEERLLPVGDLAAGKSAALGTQMTEIRSEALRFELEVGVPPVALDMLAPEKPEDAKHSYPGCTSSQRSTISSALSCAKTRGCDAADYCYYNGCTSWYYNWFGSCSYYSTVSARFDQTCFSYLLGCNYTFNCGGSYCDPGVVAYVYQNRPCETWICSAFFSQTSSFRCHAVYHESNHWTYTDDWVYGYSNCLWLADNYPSYAADNADSYSYAADYAP